MAEVVDSIVVFSLQTTQISFIHILLQYIHWITSQDSMEKFNHVFFECCNCRSQKSKVEFYYDFMEYFFFTSNHLWIWDLHILYIRYATHIKETNWYNMYISMKILVGKKIVFLSFYLLTYTCLYLLVLQDFFYSFFKSK